MPVKSGSQYRLMQGIAHGSIPAKGSLTPAVAKEFVEATPPKKRKQFSKKKKTSWQKLAEA